MVLSDRIVFKPTAEDGGYELRIPITFDRVMSAAVPEISGYKIEWRP
jgi:hypothetical protein